MMNDDGQITLPMDDYRHNSEVFLNQAFLGYFTNFVLAKVVPMLQVNDHYFITPSLLRPVK